MIQQLQIIPYKIIIIYTSYTHIYYGVFFLFILYRFKKKIKETSQAHFVKIRTFLIPMYSPI